MSSGKHENKGVHWFEMGYVSFKYSTFISFYNGSYL